MVKSTKAAGYVSLSVRDVLNMGFRRKWTFLAFFVTVVVSTVVVTYLIPQVYRSEAKFLIRMGRENLSIDPTVSGPTTSVNRDRESEVNSEVAIFTSRELAEQVVDSLGPDAFLGPESPVYPPGLKGWAKAKARWAKQTAEDMLIQLGLKPSLTRREKAVNDVIDGLAVTAERRTNIITARLDASDPQVAHDALDRLMQLYQDRHIQVYSAQAKPQFFEDQASKLRAALEQRERALAEYQAKNGITSLPQQKDVMLKQISELETQLSNVAAQVNGSKARVAALEKTLQASPKTRELSRTTGRTNSAADNLKTRLFELRVKESDLAARYADTYQPLVDLRQQISELDSQLTKEVETRTEITTGADTNYQQLDLNLRNEEAQLKDNEGRQEVLSSEVTRQRELLAALTEREVDMNTLARDVDLAQTAYRQFRDNLQRAESSAAMDLDKVSNVSVVQQATLSSDRIRPKRLMNIGFGFAAALAGGLALLLLLEFLDDTVRTREDAERRLDVPVLIEISEREFKAVA